MLLQGSTKHNIKGRKPVGFSSFISGGTPCIEYLLATAVANSIFEKREKARKKFRVGGGRYVRVPNATTIGAKTTKRLLPQRETE